MTAYEQSKEHMQRPDMILGSLIFEGKYFWKNWKNKRPQFSNPPCLHIPRNVTLHLFPSKCGVFFFPTPWIELALWFALAKRSRIDHMPIPSPGLKRPCSFSQSHLESFHWHLRKLRLPAGWHITELSHSSQGLPRPASDGRHRMEACQYQTHPASISRTAQMDPRLWEIMNCQCFKALRFGEFGFTATLTETVSIYKILKQPSGNFWEKLDPTVQE